MHDAQAINHDTEGSKQLKVELPGGVLVCDYGIYWTKIIPREFAMLQS